MSQCTLFGSFDESNYLANVGQSREGMTYRGRILCNCLRNFIEFNLPFQNDAPRGLPENWSVGPTARVQRETAFTGRSLSDVRSKSRSYFNSPIPITREGDVGDPFSGTVDRARITISNEVVTAAIIDSGIVWRPNALRATFILLIEDDEGEHRVFGDIYGDQVVREDKSGRVATIADSGGLLQLRIEGIKNSSGRASVTGTLQLWS